MQRTLRIVAIPWRACARSVAEPFDRAVGRHVPALDGVRGLAILLVFIFHCLRHLEEKAPSGAWLAWTQAGWLGVDLFFVLSGFLITGILLDTRSRPRALTHFFARRVLRIFPLYFVSLCLVFLVLPPLCGWLFPGRAVNRSLDRLGADHWWYWLYVQNWLSAARQTIPTDVFLNHFWSLAVEEQFYLVWPFVVWLVRPARLPAVCAALFGLSLLLRLGWYAADQPWIAAYVCTLTRLDSLCAGAFLAVVIRLPGGYSALAPRALPCLGLCLVVVASIHAFVPLFDFFSPEAHALGHSLFALTFAALVLVAVSATPGSVAHRLLTLKPLTQMGVYSYGFYVIHFPVYRLVVNWNGVLWVASEYQPFWICGLTFVITMALTLASWHLLEKRCLALKRHFPTAPTETESLESRRAA